MLINKNIQKNEGKKNQKKKLILISIEILRVQAGQELFLFIQTRIGCIQYGMLFLPTRGFDNTAATQTKSPRKVFYLKNSLN